MRESPAQLPASSRQAIVLAGGLGTRLALAAGDVPKPMAAVAGRPFLEHVLDRLVDRGVTTLILTVCHKRHVVMDHFGRAYRGAAVRYSTEEQPLGTGGGIALAMSASDCPHPLVLNGDSLFEADLADLANFHLARDADVTVALKPMRDFDRYGSVELSGDGRIVGFREKRPCRQGLINAGIYVVRRDLFERLGLSGKFSFEKDVLEAHTGELNLCGRAYEGYFIDIGIPDDYRRADAELR